MYEIRHSLRQRFLRLARFRGMTLVEFMVAITIGIFIALGMLLLMSRTSRSYKINDEYSRIQESGSTALRYLSDDIHMAGYFGLAGTSDTISAFDTNPADGFLDYGEDAGIFFGTTAGPGVTLADCGAALWSFQPAVAVSGVPPSAPPGARPNDPISGLPLSCINPKNYAGGPALILRGALGTMVNRGANGLPTNVTAGMLDGNTIYVQADPGNGFIFRGSQFAAYKAATYSRVVPAPPPPAGVFVDAPIYQYQSNIYYVRPCSRPAGAPDAYGNPTCTGTDDLPSPNPIPTLVRQQWQSTPAGPAYQEVGLAEGVEWINFIYGLDSLSATGAVIPVGCNTAGACATPPDGVADTYMPAGCNNAGVCATPVPANPNAWSQVVTIRVNLLIRASAPTFAYDDSVKSYDMGGGTIFNCAAVGAPCNYHRHMFSQLIEVRNIAGRRAP
jgi:type II secretory pathway pseudopilin PulG